MMKFLLIVLALAWMMTPSVSIGNLPVENSRYTLVIPCNTEKEQCMPYFRSILKYLRTFTVHYKIVKIAEKDNLRSLFIKFVEGDMCRKFLTRGAMDLQYLDVHMEQKFKDNKNYFLLYNLNHRLIMACID